MARQRSPEAHERVLGTALDLFGERGIDATSMDAIAHTSGVSKATIYNHWANREALLIDVMLMVNGLDRDPEDVDSGDLCRDLATVLSRRPPDKFDEARDRMIPAMMAYSAIHREFGDAWRHRVMEPTRTLLKRILRRGIERKLLPSTLDLEASMALLLGPLIYMKVFHDETATSDIGSKVAESFWRAHRTEGRTSPARASKRAVKPPARRRSHK
jgi:AcrR family transcriptional regulator